MKKNIFLIIIIILLSNITIIAQTHFTVTYSRSHTGFGIDDIQTLLFKGNIAMFEFYQKKEHKKIDFYEVDFGFEKYINLYNIKNKNVIEQNQLENGTLLLAKWKHTLKWKISEETKIINGYTVQKATIQSYNYPVDRFENFGIATAWFTTEIPVGIGPFRYHGLPGLILELSFERYGATYKMTKIDFEKAVVIPELNKGITITKEQSIHPETISKKWLKNQKKSNKSWWQLWD